VRWDPAGYAERELADRRALGFPPAVRLAALTGPAPAVAELLTLADLPAGADVLGPVPGREGAVRALVRVPKAHGAALARALRAAQGVRSARKAPDPVRVQIDPVEIG
jgi:primosomal protein N' (replication factor Y)